MTHFPPFCPIITHEFSLGTGVNTGLGLVIHKGLNARHTFFLSISQEQKLNILN